MWWNITSLCHWLNVSCINFPYVFASSKINVLVFAVCSYSYTFKGKTIKSIPGHPSNSAKISIEQKVTDYWHWNLCWWGFLHGLYQLGTMRYFHLQATCVQYRYHVKQTEILGYSFECCCDALKWPLAIVTVHWRRPAQLRTHRIRTQDEVSFVYSHPEMWTFPNSLHSQRCLFNACIYREDLLKLKEAKNLSINSCTWV